MSNDYAGPVPRSDADGYLYARPIRHYVGRKQQVKPNKRISRHGPAANRKVAYLEPGTTRDDTTRDEQILKLTGTCPTCAEAYSESLA